MNNEDANRLKKKFDDLLADIYEVQQRTDRGETGRHVAIMRTQTELAYGILYTNLWSMDLGTPQGEA